MEADRYRSCLLFTICLDATHLQRSRSDLQLTVSKVAAIRNSEGDGLRYVLDYGNDVEDQILLRTRHE